MNDAAPPAPRTRRARRRPASGTRPGVGEVLNALRERIVNQDIPPGAKLREQDLAQEFKVPRTRIREVFGALEQRGLINRIPNRGAVVARLDLSQVFDLYDVREVLEGLCARLATANTPPESWQELLEYFTGPLAEHAAKGEFDAFLTGYERFRRRLLETANNPLLAQMLDSIYEKTQVLIRRIIILPERAKTGLREHIAVLEAMRRGDAEMAEKLRRENMRSAKSWLLRYQKYVL
ncbi:MAG TPA: GntR family transcriptional regulator [Burkholderiales bacterium]|nr:GntR family transcriptional regulator [Burkholderiales bacterium]